MDEKDEKDSTIWMTAMCGRKEGCNQPVHQPQVSPPTFILVIIIASTMLVVLIAKSQLLDRGRCSGVKNCNAQFIVNLSTASNGQGCHINERGGLGKLPCQLCTYPWSLTDSLTNTGSHCHYRNLEERAMQDI